jgi:hypothetical protein
VNREVLRETIRDMQQHNAGADPAEIEQLIEQEVAQTRKSFWTERRR